jgi:hypothetical protein
MHSRDRDWISVCARRRNPWLRCDGPSEPSRSRPGCWTMRGCSSLSSSGTASDTRGCRPTNTCMSPRSGRERVFGSWFTTVLILRPLGPSPARYAPRPERSPAGDCSSWIDSRVVGVPSVPGIGSSSMGPKPSELGPGVLFSAISAGMPSRLRTTVKRSVSRTTSSRSTTTCVLTTEKCLGSERSASYSGVEMAITRVYRACHTHRRCGSSRLVISGGPARSVRSSRGWPPRSSPTALPVLP